ncbi:hypothetical protein [Noviherbaspirillum pedocola]|uniref:Uncharacterized protein n=1 Tax=Noviherbaspirillum pedocola TaxID=2801341 RepID=A0A934SUB2_9BURK|nr:hypothetical protein [Noviherbaspirillum pedocola]MBK4736936.1 hypothetical protein [Noviherbaspirillum pedocola]
MSQKDMERTKSDWYRSGKLGPSAQVLISARGGVHGPDGRHHVALCATDEPRETGAFISWLRTPPADLPPGPQVPGWHGIAHLHSSAGGSLAAEVQQKEADWNRGNFIVHGSCKGVAMHTLCSLANGICDAIAQHGEKPGAIKAIDMAAHAMRVAGDTIYCGGADFDAPLKIGAPRDDEQASMATVMENLESGRHEAVRISGSDRDRAALLEAMRGQQDTCEEEQGLDDKLSNMILTRTARVRIDELLALAEAYPAAHDLAMRKAGYMGASDCGAGYLAMQRWHVAFLREVRNGEGSPESLRQYLDYTGRYGSTDAEWCDRIAPALRQNRALLLVALEWDSSNKRFGLCEALRREFAAHPEDVTRLLAATQGNEAQHTRLCEFLEDTSRAQGASTGKMDAEGSRRDALISHLHFLFDTPADERDDFSSTESRVSDRWWESAPSIIEPDSSTGQPVSAASRDVKIGSGLDEYSML